MQTISDYLSSNQKSDKIKVDFYNRLLDVMPMVELEPFRQVHEIFSVTEKNQLIPGSRKKFQLVEPIAEGTFGEIWSAMLSVVGNASPAREIVVKIPLKAGTKEGVGSLIENLMSIILQCYRPTIEQLVPKTTGFQWAFPEVYFSINSEEDEQELGIIVGMSKMDSDLETIVYEDNQATFADIIDILLQLCVKLECLQETVGFLHRDMHGANVMVNTRPQPTVEVYKLNGISVKSKSKYDVFIIDLGQSCIDLARCQTCRMETLIQGEAESYKKGISCYNPSYDLRLLIASIGEGVSNKALLPKYKRRFQDLTKLAYTGVDKDFLAQKKKQGADWHAIYAELGKYKTPSIVSKTFTPTGLFKFLLRNFKSSARSIPTSDPNLEPPKKRRRRF